MLRLAAEGFVHQLVHQRSRGVQVNLLCIAVWRATPRRVSPPKMRQQWEQEILVGASLQLVAAS